MQQSPFSLSGQINMLINAVADIDRKQAIFTEEKKNSYETRRKGLKREQTKLEQQQYKDEIIDFLRKKPRSKTTEISKYLDNERSLIFKRLRKLEVDGVVLRIANGNILRWELIK